MNIKQKIINDIIQIVYDNTVLDLDDGSKSYDIKDLTRHNRSEVVVFARCLLVQELLLIGFSIDTIAKVLNKTKPSIRHLMKLSIDYERNNKIYNDSKKEIIKKCKEYIELNSEKKIQIV